jgi:drug/metabolite transporter (DMT)-like permease
MGERASWRQWLAFLVAMGGVVLVKGFDPRVSVFHAGLGVLSAICSGLAYNFIRKLKDTDHPDVVVMYFPLITIPVVLPFLFGKWVWPTPLEWFIIAVVGICTQIAQMCMTRAYQLEKAADVIIFKYTGIAYALLFGFVLFGETVQLMSILGMVIVVMAVYTGTIGRRAQRHIGPSAESWPQSVKPDK